MGGRNSKNQQDCNNCGCMDSKRPFNTSIGQPKDTDTSTFSTDLFMKIGTRVATITAVYERSTLKPTQPPSIPCPPIPSTNVSSSKTAIDNHTYEIPNPSKVYLKK